MRRAALLTASALALATAAGCSTAHHTATVAAQQFWTVPGHRAGDTTGLHPDLSTYCGILRSTLQAGTSPLSGLTTGDPTVAATVRAWVGDLQSTAPAAVHSAWQVEGQTLIALSTGGKATATALSAQQAGATISAHAKSACGLDLGTAVG